MKLSRSRRLPGGAWRAAVSLTLLAAACDGAPADGDDTDVPADTDLSIVACDPDVAPPPAALVAAANTPRTRDLEVAAARCVAVEDLDVDGAVDVLWIPEDQSLLQIAWSGLAGDAVTSASPQPPTAMFNGACAAGDFDADGDVEVLYATDQGLARVDISPERALTFVTEGLLTDAPWTDASVLVPVDLDGVDPIDLVVVNDGALSGECALDLAAPEVSPGSYVPGRVYCLLADGQGAYANRPCPGGLRDLPGPTTQDVSVTDVDGDGVRDLLIFVEFGPLLLSRGVPGGGLAAPEVIALPEAPANLGAQAVDLDHDGAVDLVLGTTNGARPHRGTACGAWATTGVTTLPGTERRFAWTPRAVDLDRNGLLDVVTSTAAAWTDDATALPACELGWVAGRSPLASVVLRGEGARTVTLLQATEAENTVLVGRVAVGDLDGDGGPDLALFSPKGSHLVDVGVPAAGAWLRVRPLNAAGTPPLGMTTVRVRGAWGALQVVIGADPGSERTADFGLGAATGPVEVIVTWPDGEVQALSDVSLDQQVVVRREAR